jgi:hypothetical protein
VDDNMPKEADLGLVRTVIFMIWIEPSRTPQNMSCKNPQQHQGYIKCLVELP